MRLVGRGWIAGCIQAVGVDSMEETDGPGKAAGLDEKNRKQKINIRNRKRKKHWIRILNRVLPL